jgi:4,5-DOPA dioxygenase extradiol
MKLATLMFVSHGSPMFALDSSLAAQNLASQTERFDNVDGILIISPHWLTRGNYVISHEKPETLYDFGGFPPALYQLKYPASGSNYMANKVINSLNQSGIETKAENNRGWDHGVWVPLLHLRPHADKPVVQLSLNAKMSPDELENMGKALMSLRQQNIAIICSGSLTHNLYDIRMSHERVADYAIRFEKWARETVVAGNVEDAKQPHIKSASYAKSHPTPEHYSPLIIAMAASDDSEKVNILASPILHHSISMESYVWV